MFQPHIIRLLIVNLVFSAGVAVTVFAIDHRPSVGKVVAGERSDGALNDRVETLLRTDIGLAGSRFRVSTQAAVVTLAGDVPDRYSLGRAMDLASSVKGVREVRNALEVDFPK